MKHNEITSLQKINIENLENIFNVYQDKNGMYFYNLLQTIVFPTDLPQNLFDKYIIGYGDTWPLISYKTLKNTGLWWIILLANNIQNPISPGPVPGTVLKIPIMDVVKEVLVQMRSQ